jgi:mRNA-degrading endonuclease toxin of MazEF toxin-antitoxin module
MTTFEFGAIVLVNFPIPSTKQNKKRSALVILDIGDDDCVLAPITTKVRRGKGDFVIKDWSLSGLLLKSCVRLAKIACLKKNDISKTLGTLSRHDRKNVLDDWNSLYSFS